MSQVGDRISNVEVAVLAERVDRMLVDYSELRGLILAQSAQLTQVPLISQNIIDLMAKTDRIFSTLKEHNGRIAVLEQDNTVYKVIMKVVAASLIASLTLIGWGWQQGERLYNVDQAADRRLLLLEYKMGIPRPTADGEK